MNPDLYKSEFRNFKYLKSSATLLNYIKANAYLINSIQTSEINDPNFVWAHRVEFLEQLLDLSKDTIYIVDPGEDHAPRSKFMYTEVSVHTVDYPTMWIGNIAQPDQGTIVTKDDISEIEHSFGQDCFICSGEYWTNKTTVPHAFRLRDIILLGLPSYTAVFYDRLAAEHYGLALKTVLNKNQDAVSAFTRLI